MSQTPHPSTRPVSTTAVRSPITTHILDLGRGFPAADVDVILDRRYEGSEGKGWRMLGRSTTDGDGRASQLLPARHSLEAGVYRLRFVIAAYFARHATRSFYPHIDIVFEVSVPEEHHHVPLLLNAHGYSTYRGS